MGSATVYLSNGKAAVLAEFCELVLRSFQHSSDGVPGEQDPEIRSGNLFTYTHRPFFLHGSN